MLLGICISEKENKDLKMFNEICMKRCHLLNGIATGNYIKFHYGCLRMMKREESSKQVDIALFIVRQRSFLVLIEIYWHNTH